MGSIEIKSYMCPLCHFITDKPFNICSACNNGKRQVFIKKDNLRIQKANKG